ncbi:hypothetical protein GCM10010284_59730 [Streptomyces rubiginosohelvolus]|uniref:Uncharacterized protein n=1 Tax=Streptomyces rubiginosohelvolus TaxID=67362 RepID=A0ABQ3BYA2_9ACTN|nr:hypothetical protein GCM10010284_59730 [Streptomyces rubiginosohelvolus]GGZ60914.1 hypothetical protein GCM10010328_39260 [Streptomyces pluricolorescens]
MWQISTMKAATNRIPVREGSRAGKASEDGRVDEGVAARPRGDGAPASLSGRWLCGCKGPFMVTNMGRSA